MRPPLLPPPAASLALALVALAPPAAADVLVVGPGPDADHREIQAAVDAAAPGDVVLVQPGTYAGFVVDVPVRIVAEGTGPAVVFATTAEAITVGGIAAGEEVVVSGLEVDGGAPGLFADTAAVLVTFCSGTVVLHDLVVDPVNRQIGVDVEHSDRVLLLGCEVRDAGTSQSPAVDASDATLLVADCVVTGWSPPDDPFSLRSGAHAVRVTDGALRVWRSTLVGGDGNVATVKPSGVANGGAGVVASAADVRLHGGPAGGLEGGDGGLGPFFGLVFDGAPGLRVLDGSTAAIQVGLSLAGGTDGTGTTTAAPVEVEAGSSAVPDPLVHPTLTASSGHVPVGGSVELVLEGAAGASQALFLSAGTGPDLLVPGVAGVGVLDLGGLATVAVVPLAGPSAALPVTVPPEPALAGAVALLQSVQLPPGDLAISGPLAVAIVP